MEKKTQKAIIGIILFVLPVIILGLLSLIPSENVDKIPTRLLGVDSSFELAYQLSLGPVDHHLPSVIIAIAYQSVGLFVIGEFIISSILSFMDKEKTAKQKTKEFFIKLIVVLIIFILSILFAKLIWDWGEINLYEYADRYGRF